MALIIDYIWNNKEWIFSGIGISALAVLIFVLRRVFISPPQIKKGTRVQEIEEAICKKSEADFQIFMEQFNSMPIPESQQNKIEKLIKESYGSKNVLKESLKIRIDHYIIPLVKELIKIELDLRYQHQIPFSKVRIRKLRDKIHSLIDVNWRGFVTGAYDDAIRNALRINKCAILQEDKQIPLRDKRDIYLYQNPDGLYNAIDNMLEKAYADSVLSINKISGMGT